MFRYLLVLFFLLISSGAFAENPKEIKEYFGNQKSFGNATLHFFGWKLYDGELWQAGKKFSYKNKFALRLRYNINIEREELVKTSIEELQRIKNIDEAREEFYVKELTKLFPAKVSSGDTITAVNDYDNARVVLYHNGKMRGETKDKNFPAEFFAIWLDPETQGPDFRAKILNIAGK